MTEKYPLSLNKNKMDKETSRVVKKFASRIRKKYQPELFLLFGSRARGDNFKSSDYDFIIVSKKFHKTRFILRPAEFFDYWDESVDIEPLCYTPEEFERKKKEIGIVSQAVKEGIEI